MLGVADSAIAATTYLGDPVNYNFGTVQVQITVDGSNKITQIDTPQVSTRGSNASYTNYAVPTLVKEALAAQSANIQGVSGASYLSRGWITSLASAIAKMGGTATVPSATPSATSVAPVAPSTPSARPLPTIAPQSGGEGEGFGDDNNRPRPQGENGDDGGGERRRRPPVSPIAPVVPRSPAPITKSPTPTASPSPTDLGLGLKPGAGVIQKSITCLKGATKKVVKGFNPKCPAGFTLKKP